MLHVQYVGMTLKQHLLYYHAISIIGSFMQLMKCLRHAKKDAYKSMIRYNLKITQFQNCFQLYKILSNLQMPVNITSHVYIRIRDMTYLSLL